MISSHGRTSSGQQCANISASNQLAKISVYDSTDSWSTRRSCPTEYSRVRWLVCTPYVIRDREYLYICKQVVRDETLTKLLFRPYDAKNPYLAKILVNRELHKGGGRSCMHIEFDIEGSKMRYDAGTLRIHSIILVTQHTQY